MSSSRRAIVVCIEVQPRVAVGMVAGPWGLLIVVAIGGGVRQRERDRRGFALADGRDDIRNVAERVPTPQSVGRGGSGLVLHGQEVERRK